MKLINENIKTLDFVNIMVIIFWKLMSTTDSVALRTLVSVNVI